MNSMLVDAKRMLLMSLRREWVLNQYKPELSNRLTNASTYMTSNDVFHWLSYFSGCHLNQPHAFFIKYLLERKRLQNQGRLARTSNLLRPKEH